MTCGVVVSSCARKKRSVLHEEINEESITGIEEGIRSEKFSLFICGHFYQMATNALCIS